jgi:hypothetical protein
MRDVSAELGHLQLLAGRDPAKRFDRLYRLLCHPTLLALARDRIANNRGAQSPGVDGQRMSDMTTATILQLSTELSQGTYQSQPVRRVYIPKVRLVLPKCAHGCKDGRQERRQLPT